MNESPWPKVMSMKPSVSVPLTCINFKGIFVVTDILITLLSSLRRHQMPFLSPAFVPILSYKTWKQPCCNISQCLCHWQQGPYTFHVVTEVYLRPCWQYRYSPIHFTDLVSTRLLIRIIKSLSRDLFWTANLASGHLLVACTCGRYTFGFLLVDII